MLLLRAAFPSAAAATPTTECPFTTTTATTSSKSRRMLMGLCCAARPLVDDSDLCSSSPACCSLAEEDEGDDKDADVPRQHVPRQIKDTTAAMAAAANGAGGTSDQQHHHQQQPTHHQQQVVLISADMSPEAAVAAELGSTLADFTQQQLPLLTRLSIDVHTSGSAAAADMATSYPGQGAVTLHSCSATVAGTGGVCAQGSSHHDDQQTQQDTPSMGAHHHCSGPLQQPPGTAGMCSGSSNNDTMGAASILPSTLGPCRDDLAQQQQQQQPPLVVFNAVPQEPQQRGAAAGAPAEAHPLMHPDSLCDSSDSNASNAGSSSSIRQAVTPVAGWSDSLPAAAARGEAAATTSKGPPPAAAAAVATAASAAGGGSEDPADLKPSPELPAEALKLHKLESGSSFRMLQPGLSTSFHASGSLPLLGSPHSLTGTCSPAGLAAASCCDGNPGAAGHEGISSSSSSSIGLVSRRSTAGHSSARVLTPHAVGLNPGSTRAAAGAAGGSQEPLPAPIPEHCVSITSSSGETISTSAAVAAAFQADAAAVQDLLQAASASAASLPAQRPSHTRSKSAGPLGSTAAAAAAGPVVQHLAAAASSGPDMCAAANTIVSSSAVAAAAGDCGVAGAVPTAAAMPAMPPAVKSRSVAESPFAQADLQQVVAASLLSHSQPAVQGAQTQHTAQAALTPAQPFSSETAAPAAAAAVAGAAGSQPNAARANSAGLPPTLQSRPSSSSSSYRSTPYGLSTLQQHQQQQQQPPSQAPLDQRSQSARPSLTSRLSWASSFTMAEPQTQVFVVLNPQEDADTADSTTRAAAGHDGGTVFDQSSSSSRQVRMLRPSKSLSSLSSLRRGGGSWTGASGSSSSRRSTSGINAGSNRLVGSGGFFGLARAKSSASLLGELRGSYSQPQPQAAAAAGEVAGSGSAAGVSSNGSGGSGSRGSSSSAATTPAAGRSRLRSILRLPYRDNSNSSLRQSSNEAVTAAAAAGNNRSQQPAPQADAQQQQRQQAMQRVGSSKASMQQATLPPLPRPPSSFSVEAAPAGAAGMVAGAAADHSGSNSNSNSNSKSSGSNRSSTPAALPLGLASAEGPFAVQQMMQLADDLGHHQAAAAAAAAAGGGGGGGSSSVLLSTGQYGARQQQQRQMSVASAPTQLLLLRETHSMGASSIGQLSSSGSSSGTGGSLMSLAVTRMHSAAASCDNIAAGAAASQALPKHSRSASSLTSLGRAASTGSATSSTTSRSSSTQVAKAFADAFLEALAVGNTKWASEPAVSQLMHEAAKMVGLDKQLHVGRTAIIRRLNGGMEQLVKMAQATTAPGSTPAAAGADANANASSGSEDDDATTAEASSSSAAAAATAAADRIAAVLGPLVAQKLPKAQLSVSCPDPKARPSQVEAVYTFKWGIRKFTMKDEFIVREGQILRLRRSRA